MKDRELEYRGRVLDGELMTDEYFCAMRDYIEILREIDREDGYVERQVASHGDLAAAIIKLFGQVSDDLDFGRGNARDMLVRHAVEVLHYDQLLKLAANGASWVPTNCDLGGNSDAAILAALRLGFHAGQMDSHIDLVWRARGGLGQQSSKRRKKDERQGALRQFIAMNGPVPDLGKLGKQNPERTRYYQKFERAWGQAVSVDTFNRDVKALLGEGTGAA